jgi:hypothetical protein
VLLKALGITPVLFSEASHLAQVTLGECELFVPCKSEAAAQHIKDTVTAFLGSPVVGSAA